MLAKVNEKCTEFKGSETIAIYYFIENKQSIVENVYSFNEEDKKRNVCGVPM